MKLSLLLIAYTITAYTFSMENTITLPDQQTLKQQLGVCYCNPKLLNPILELANKEVRATRIKAAIDSSVHEHSKTSEFNEVVDIMFTVVLAKQMDISWEYTRAVALHTKTADVTDLLLQKFPEMHTAVRALQNTQN